jgi:hypothetical protein
MRLIRQVSSVIRRQWFVWSSVGGFMIALRVEMILMMAFLVAVGVPGVCCEFHCLACNYDMLEVLGFCVFVATTMWYKYPRSCNRY